jgi:hypothetical protein
MPLRRGHDSGVEGATSGFWDGGKLGKRRGHRLLDHVTASEARSDLDAAPGRKAQEALVCHHHLKRRRNGRVFGTFPVLLCAWP